MPVPVLEAIADAIQRYEGWEPTSHSYRNRNPGNLRASNPAQNVDADGYRVFSTYLDGYRALLRDLTLKVTGKSAHKVNAESTLYDFFSIYAPAGDHNAPQRYAAFVADFLCRVYDRGDIWSGWTISDVFANVRQALPSGDTAA